MAKEVKNEKETVATAVSRTETFLTENKKTIWISVSVLVVLAAACYVWYKFVYLTEKTEALAQMYVAEAAFRDGKYDTALKGDGNVLGFEEIIGQYGSKAGKAVYLYAAVCELKANDPDKALSYLSEYSVKDPIMAGRVEALKGDAYCDKEEYENAASCFEAAAHISDNVFAAAYLMKAGFAYEAVGRNDKALAAYRSVKENYPQSMEAMEVDKYITRLEVQE